MKQRVELALKRIFDTTISVLALAIISPLIALVALAIKLDDGGPVFFVQQRVGYRGKIFRCFKFRTMIVAADRKGPAELVRGDIRFTRVGAFLRHWTLDEIPQLFNVLVGDMSIVGPRPTLPEQVARYTDWQRRRLEVKPGMAGWAWIQGRNRIPWAKRIELDVWYVENWSFWLDLQILMKAFVVLIRREGLYDLDGRVRDL